jgi:nucleoside-diphosphate kinase
MIALEVSGEGAVDAVRAIAGPRDVEVARRVRPHTLRARHGVSAAAGGPGSRARLAVHATDLAEDGPLETDYVFNLVD